jgi:hypothetical protein
MIPLEFSSLQAIASLMDELPDLSISMLVLASSQARSKSSHLLVSINPLSRGETMEVPDMLGEQQPW